MALASRAGGDSIISCRRWFPAFYSSGPIISRGICSGNNLCISMCSLVSRYVIWKCSIPRPQSVTWSFRDVCAGIIQYLQFMYQRGVLYRLKALGERHNMDITIEGFHSWMWRGLSFLLPFLYAGYAFQLYNAYSLYKLSFHEEASWQVRSL